MEDKSGIILGMHADGSIIRLPGCAPVAVHAPTGTGKTADFGIPNAYAHQGSMVCLDIKGEMYEATAGYRKAMGHEVFKFEPAAENGCSHRWNPFDCIDRSSDKRFKYIHRQANLLFPEIHGTGGNGNQEFWDNAGRQAFSAVATILAESPGPLTMERITHLFTRQDGYKVLAKMVADRRAAGDPYSEIAVNGLSDYIGNDTKLRNDITKTASVKLQTWMYDPQICAATDVSDFRLEDLRKKPMSIYVVIAPGDMPRLRPLLRLFFDQMIMLNTVVTPQQDPTLKYEVLCMLDEFARLGRVDSLAHAAQYVRGFGLGMVYVVQDPLQLKAIYTEDVVRDIFSNVGAEVVFGVVDHEVAEMLEKRLGDNTELYTTYSAPRLFPWFKLGRLQQSETLQRRPLMLDQEIAMMPEDEQLILRRGMKRMKTKRVRWFTDERFKTRLKPPPDVPQLNVKIRYDDGTTEILPPVPKGPQHHGR